MKKWTIRTRLLFSFAAVLVLMFAMGMAFFWSLSLIQAEVTDVRSDGLPSLTSSFEIVNAWATDYTLTQQRIDETDRATLGQLDLRLQTNQAALDKLIAGYESFVDVMPERRIYETLKAARGAYLRIQKDLLSLAAGGKAQEAQAMLHDQLNPALQTAEVTTRALVDYNKGDAEESVQKVFAAIRIAKIDILVSLVLGLVLAFLFSYLLLRVGNRQLRQLSLELEKSSQQVTSSVSEIAATSKEQFATAKELVKTMNEVATFADQSATLAGSGQTGLTVMEETMRGVMDAAGSINAKLAVLNEKAGNINQIVTTITKVADQTNLLSLNAAIEAEKAGEHGRGFAVVATEIRRLSDQTGVATYDIEQTVKEIQSAVSASVMSMDKFSEEVRRGIQDVQQVAGQLSQIIQQVQALAPRVESVNDGMQAQATGAEQITQALGQLSEAAQQTVDSLRQSSTAIDGLNQVVSGLSVGMKRLKVLN
jgi:methyl-accepting chemotaxis protein WspA